MIALTCHPGPHTAESLARRMFRNKQQIQSDLRWWQGMLEGERALAVRRAPDHGRGPRVDHPGLRHVHAVLVLHRLRCAGASCRRCSGSIEPYDRQFLERCIAEMQRDLGFEFSSNAQWQFGVYLCIMVTRLRLGHGLTAWRGADGSTPFFAYLKKRLERHFSLDGERRGDGASAATWPIAARGSGAWPPWSAYEPSERARAVTDDVEEALKKAFGAAACPRMCASPWPFCSRAAWRDAPAGWWRRIPTRRSVKYEAMDGACLLVLGALRGAFACRGRPVQPGLRSHCARAARLPRPGRRAALLSGGSGGELRNRSGPLGRASHREADEPP